jgi:phosphohistidine phosphatase
MIKDLLILRHGKAEQEPADDDFNRDLADKGKRHTQRIAVWLQRQQLLPDTIVSSPARRALTTAQKCCKAMWLDARMINKDQRIYEADIPEIIDILREYNDRADRLMLVGHNPILDELLDYLINPSQAEHQPGHLSTASLAWLQLPPQWETEPKGAANLVEIVHPATLPKRFPFPAPESKELRKRPAYYYTQSSVIPYRNQDKGLEVLVTRSSQKKHWVVPKGIADPGHSLQESAAKEAWEEAGVEGEVADQPIGNYQYAKWGATCTVEVFPMKVTRQLSDEEWEESHRGRQWLPAGEAASKVRQPELGELITKLEKQLG